MNNLILNLALHHIYLTLDQPLKAVSSNESSLLIKTISAIAIGILSVVSLGSYAVYSYMFFKERKVAALHLELLTLIKEKDHDGVDELIKDHPVLKTVLNSIFDENGYRSNYPMTMAEALENNDLLMIKILFKNGARVDNMRMGAMTYAIEHGYVDIVKFLAENGEMLLTPIHYAYTAMNYKNSLDVMRFFIEKVTPVEAAENEEFFLEICSRLEVRGKLDPKYLEVLEILLENGPESTAVPTEDLTI